MGDSNSEGGWEAVFLAEAQVGRGQGRVLWVLPSVLPFLPPYLSLVSVYVSVSVDGFL